MIYNFRFDKSHIEEILRRLREEKLLSHGKKILIQLLGALRKIQTRHSSYRVWMNTWSCWLLMCSA